GRARAHPLAECRRALRPHGPPRRRPGYIARIVIEDFEGHIPRESAIDELGLAMEAVGDELHGWADVRATMWAPGTEMLRTSVAMSWADALLGLHAMKALAPRLTVTLELDAHLFDDIAGV